MDSIKLNKKGKKQLEELVEYKMKYLELDAKRLSLLEEIQKLELKYDRALDDGKRKPIIKKSLDEKKVELEFLKKNQLEIILFMDDLKKELKPRFKKSIEYNLKNIMSTYEYKEDMNKRSEAILNIEKDISYLEYEIEKEQNSLNKIHEKILSGDISYLDIYKETAGKIRQLLNGKSKKMEELNELNLDAAKIINAIDDDKINNENLYDGYEMQLSILNDDVEKGGMDFDKYFDDIIEALIAKKMIDQEKIKKDAKAAEEEAAKKSEEEAAKKAEEEAAKKAKEEAAKKAEEEAAKKAEEEAAKKAEEEAAKKAEEEAAKKAEEEAAKKAEEEAAKKAEEEAAKKAEEEAAKKAEEEAAKKAEEEAAKKTAENVEKSAEGIPDSSIKFKGKRDDKLPDTVKELEWKGVLSRLPKEMNVDESELNANIEFIISSFRTNTKEEYMNAYEEVIRENKLYSDESTIKKVISQQNKLYDIVKQYRGNEELAKTQLEETIELPQPPPTYDEILNPNDVVSLKKSEDSMPTENIGTDTSNNIFDYESAETPKRSCEDFLKIVQNAGYEVVEDEELPSSSKPMDDDIMSILSNFQVTPEDTAQPKADSDVGTPSNQVVVEFDIEQSKELASEVGSEPGSEPEPLYESGEPERFDEGGTCLILEDSEIDTENIPSLYFKYLEHIAFENAYTKLENDLDWDINENLLKYTGKKTLREKFREITLRYEQRRKEGKSIFAFLRKCKNPIEKNWENDAIKSSIQEDIERLKEGKPVKKENPYQTSIARKYLRNERDKIFEEIRNFRACKDLSGLKGYDRKIALLRNAISYIEAEEWYGAGFTMHFVEDESYVNQNGELQKVVNPDGEQHYVKYADIIAQIKATIEKLEIEKEKAEQEMKKDDDVAK